ncbi:helix-turn-helix domain-containing protein [Streptomyces nigra]|uniref:helix-turn-helix domain-containing protein n=1 Tax=Streptomyces nigra TaxID=1827580 RepID=UPI0036BC7026
MRTFAGRRRLHLFLQAANYPSLATYCRDSGMSPSALTPQIQHLERELQGQLLIRGQHGHRMRLTDFGEKILAVAQPYADQLGACDAQGCRNESCDRRSVTDT